MGARVRIAILAAVTVAAVGALPVGAVAAPLTCASTITRDVRLKADLDCSFAEITIDADRVTVDLNGHILVARIVVDGHDRVTIRNGTLTAITLRDSRRSRLVNLTLPAGDGHVELIDSSRNVIKRISVGGIAGGISLTRSDRNLIRHSFMFGIQGGGLSGDAESDRNEIRNNRAVGAIGGIGIAIGGSRNIIAGNTASGDAPFGSGLPAEGILLFGGDRNVLAGNDVVSDTDGILVKAAASRTIVARNTANGSGDDGIDVESALPPCGATRRTQRRPGYRGRAGRPRRWRQQGDGERQPAAVPERRLPSWGGGNRLHGLRGRPGERPRPIHRRPPSRAARGLHERERQVRRCGGTRRRVLPLQSGAGLLPGRPRWCGPGHRAARWQLQCPRLHRPELAPGVRPAAARRTWKATPRALRAA